MLHMAIYTFGTYDPIGHQYHIHMNIAGVIH